MRSIPSFLNTFPNSNTFSKPPITSRFRYNSGAILKYISIPIALWWVKKGRAIAPPALGCSVGVSTSKKFSDVIKVLISCKTLNLVLIAFLALSLTTKSKYLCLNLVSLSFNPCHFSGKFLKDFVKRTKLFNSIESSPFLVFIIVPDAPAMSPTSIFDKYSCSSSLNSPLVDTS